MKKGLLIVTALFICLASFAQVDNPIKWSFSAIKKGDKLYEINITALVSKPWHVYSQNTPAGGPIPTQFTFTANPLLSLDGVVKENGNLQTVHDDNFKLDVKYYSDKVVFTQMVKVKAAVTTHATGSLQYMVCNDEKCLPPKKVPFDITLQ